MLAPAAKFLGRLARFHVLFTGFEQGRPASVNRSLRLFVRGETAATFRPMTLAAEQPLLAARLAGALRRAGADTMFGLPGGGPNLDVVGAALAEGMRFVLAHGETAAAIMAGTYGRITGQPAPVVVTRGPGAASVVNGTAQATLDRYPVVVITDTVPASQSARVPHQRLDQRAMMAPVAALSTTVSDASRTEDLEASIAMAVAWPSGAVHLDFDPSGPMQPVPTAGPSSVASDTAAMVDQARLMISEARQPLVLVGFEAAQWGDQLRSVLEGFGCPVLTTYQAVGSVPTEGAVHAGLFTNGALERPILDQADLIIALGFDEVEPIPTPWSIAAPVVRLSTVPQESPYMPVDADVVAPIETLFELLSPAGFEWPAGAAVRTRQAQREALQTESSGFGPLQLVATALAALPGAVTTTVDAGAHFLAVMPNWRVDAPLRLLISNGLATMGFALPAAIGAALARPHEPVLALTGDGGLSMVLGELETVARLDLPITVLVFNDAALSLIEIKQKERHGGAQAVRYRALDFAAIAAGSGLESTVVTTAEQLAEALADGWDRPRLIDARIDPADYPHLIKATRG